MLTILTGNVLVASKQHDKYHLKSIPNVLNGWVYFNKVSISNSVDFSDAMPINNRLCHCYASQNSLFSNLRKKDLARVKTYESSPGSNFAFPRT